LVRTEQWTEVFIPKKSWALVAAMHGIPNDHESIRRAAHKWLRGIKRDAVRIQMRDALAFTFKKQKDAQRFLDKWANKEKK